MKKKSKVRERRYERVNSKGDIIEVIEETLPGKRETYGNMVYKSTNHNLYQSGSHRQKEKRYKQIMHRKKNNINRRRTR